MWPRSRQDDEDAEDMLYVVGEKVLLRDKRPEDIAEDYAWRRDPELSKLDASQPVEMPYAEYRRYAREEMEYRSRWSKRFAIETHQGQHIGNCMYYDIDEQRGEAELGIMIGDREYWSQGYGCDSVCTLLDYIFTSTELNKVYLHTLSWNERARRSFANAGFVEVKDVRRNRKDFVRMEAIRDDWANRRKSKDDKDNNRTPIIAASTCETERTDPTGTDPIG